MPRISQEGACIARLGARCLVSWPDNSPSTEEEEEEQEEEEGHEEGEEQGEAGPELLSSSAELEQGEMEQEAEPSRQ